ncbi:MAG: glycoside-pentoside-hexuronide (GPH):cation symporter [Chloroflexota bacterium]
MLLRRLQSSLPPFLAGPLALLTIEDGELSWFEKIGYAVGEGGGNLIFQLVSIFYLFYLTDVVGISPGAAGTLMLITRLLDGVNDPLTGFLLDKVKLPPRLGRIKGWLLISIPLLFLNVIALFSVPDWSNGGKLIWVYGSYIVFSIVFDLVITPYGSLMAVMTREKAVRTQLSAMRALFSGAAIFVITIAVVKLVDYFPSPRIGWFWTSVILGIFACIALSITYFSVTERIQPINKDLEYEFKDLIAIVLKNRPLIIIFLFVLFTTAGRTIVNTANIYYFSYNLGNEDLMVQASFFNAAVLASFVFTPILSKIYGLQKTAMLGIVITAISTVWRFFIPSDQIWIIMLSYALFAIGSGFPWVLGYTFLTEVIDYTEKVTGYRADNMINSAYAFIYKISQGLGSALPAYVLAITAYNPDAIQQTPHTLNGILLIVTLVPAAITILGAAALYFYPLKNS